MVGSVLVTTPGSVHSTCIELQLLIIPQHHIHIPPRPLLFRRYKPTKHRHRHRHRDRDRDQDTERDRERDRERVRVRARVKVRARARGWTRCCPLHIWWQGDRRREEGKLGIGDDRALLGMHGEMEEGTREGGGGGNEVHDGCLILGMFMMG